MSLCVLAFCIFKKKISNILVISSVLLSTSVCYVLCFALFNTERTLKTIFTWKPHFKHTRMSWDAAGSPSIIVLSFRQSEHTNHTLESTDFFTELRSTALLTCWQVNPD